MDVQRQRSRGTPPAWLIALLVVAGCGPSETDSDEPQQDPQARQQAAEASQKGSEHLQKGELDEAIASFTEALEPDAESIEALGLKAASFIAVKLDATSIEALEGRAAAYTQKEEHRKALGDYSTLCASKPASAPYHVLRGKCLMALEDFGEAAKDYAIAIYFDKENGEAHWRRAKALEALGDQVPQEGAEGHYARAKELGYQPPAEQ